MNRTATPADVMELAENMREADIEEVRATIGLGPLEAVSVGFMQSDDPRALFNPEGELVGIVGIVPIVPNSSGSIWFLSTPALEKGYGTVFKWALEWLDEQQALYPVLHNVVAESNVVHRRLLKHLGFKFLDPIDNYGAGKIRVIPFERRP